MARLTDLLRNGLSISGHERNCCFMNTGAARFANASSATGLDSGNDGRAYGLVDWDHDGDLDLWATNRTSPRVQFLRNNTESDRHFVKVLLEGNGTTTNRDAIGARVELVLQSAGELKAIKTLHAGDGFLSQSSKWLHFGLDDQQQIDHIKVHWPAGAVEEFSDIKADQHYRLVQGSGMAQSWSRPQPAQRLRVSQSQPLKATDQARVPLRYRIALPAFHYQGLDGKQVAFERHQGSPTLINFWASWCQPCLKELSDFEKQHDQLAKTGLKIVALSVDELAEDKASNAEAARALIKQHAYPFDTGMATEELVGNIETVFYFLFEHRRPWAVPTSFLLDSYGRLSVIYVGRVEVEELMADVKKLELNDEQWLEASLPLQGRWSGSSGHPNLVYLVKAFLDEGYEDTAINYIEKYGDYLGGSSRFPKLLVRLGIYLRDEKEQLGQAMAYFQRAAEINPSNYGAHYEVAMMHESQKQWKDAVRHFERSIKANPDWATSRFHLARALIHLKRSEEAVSHLQKAAQIDPTLAGPHYHLASIFLESDLLEEAEDHFRLAYKLEPENLAAINGLAWTLATNPESNQQITAEAVRLAKVAAEMTKNNHPQILDTLSAAYAADGQFEKAVATAKRAIQLATKAGSKALVAEISERLERYQKKQPATVTHSR